MVDEQTWKACMSSEIFREYLGEELRKEAELERTKGERTFNELELKVDAESKIWEEFESFQKKLASSPALKAKLRQAREALELHPELVEKVDKNFINGLGLLSLDEE